MAIFRRQAGKHRAHGPIRIYTSTK